jgi:hypothetical protein
MQEAFTWPVGNPKGSAQRLRLWHHLALLLIMLGIMPGCSSGGGGGADDATRSCGGSSINDFMNAQVARPSRV